MSNQGCPTPDTASEGSHSPPLFSSRSQSSQFVGDVSQDSQLTQPASQPLSQLLEENPDLWGYLAPRNPAVNRLDFYKNKPTYLIGRHPRSDYVLTGQKISHRHCKISWELHGEGISAVTIVDTSSNGTFINHGRVGKDRTAVLRDGNEVAFGTAREQFQNGGTEDYRYIFKFLADTPRPGGLLSGYELCYELGHGHFGQVHYAIHQRTGDACAVKIVPRNHLHAPQGSRSWAVLEREINILRGLRHPNICEFKEAIYEENAINIVLEYVSGGNLDAYIGNSGCLEESEAQRLTYQICDALAYVHAKGIAHRDLKPENILLTASNPAQIKVADFGLAKAVTSVSQLNTMCGTPGYIAPEVVLHQHLETAYDCVIDSWSLGVVVFNMLTGRMPFRERTEPSAYASEPQDPTDPSSIDWSLLSTYGVSADGVQFVRRLLESQPRHRMSAADALRHPWLASYAPHAGTSRRGSPPAATTSRMASGETTKIKPGPDPSQ
ncbi:kinase-like protein [Obba rivulosa]|uniref:Kinase-like protein n=1 Tax=Obba rivulosa TaxID=1052685 RepID=A0A8E2DN63_9APHY|nr:kinase-like protein [Obba rivulosa]